MRLSRLSILAVFAAFVMIMPGAQAAESVGDQADMAEIDAMDLEKAGNLDAAIAKHREAIKLIDTVPKYAKKVATFKENFAMTLLSAANAKFNVKDTVGAQALLEEALALDPAGKFAITKRVKESLGAVKGTKLNQDGVALIKAGDYTGAVAKFDEVLALDPENKSARINKDIAEAQIAIAAGNPADAVVKLQHALSLDGSLQFVRDQMTKAQADADAKAAKEAEEAKKKKK